MSFCLNYLSFLIESGKCFSCAFSLLIGMRKDGALQDEYPRWLQHLSSLGVNHSEGLSLFLEQALPSQLLSPRNYWLSCCDFGFECDHQARQ